MMARGFDRLAGVYDVMAWLVYGTALRKAQACMLPLLPREAQVLVVGGGAGWFLEQLLRVAHPRHVRYVELSPRMMYLARARIERNCPHFLDRVEFVQGSVEDVDAEGEYDVVVTHCLLDMFEGSQLQGIVQRLSASLRAGGGWYFSDFRHVPRWPMRWVSGALIWAMYRFFRLTCKIPARRLP